MIFASGIYIYARTDIIKNSLKANKNDFWTGICTIFQQLWKKVRKTFVPYKHYLSTRNQLYALSK